jgi:substrate import-associated zinc metallohydrolase lipoprotein
MLSALAKVWFDPFIYAAPYGFLQQHTPKTIVLAGSPEYAADGNSMVLGTAEGATKIFLTNVNAFEPTNATVIRSYLHVIEHEYTHILNQDRLFPDDFKQISRQFYDPTGWLNYDYNNHEAWERGYFTNYSMTAPDEDFAEVVASILVKGVDWFEREVIPIAEKSTVNPNAAQNLRDKVEIVRKYYKDEFDIILFDTIENGKEVKGLATLVQEAVEYVVNSAN